MGFLAGSVMVNIGANLTGFNRGMAVADARLRTFGRTLGGVRGHVGAFSRGMSSAGLSMVGLRGATLAASGGFLAGGGLITAFGLTVKQAANFQSALNQIQAVSGATKSQMAQVSAKAQALGADLTLPATSATDAARAMTELVKGGLSVGQAMTAAKGVLQLSAAAQVDNATAAQITARSLNAFGLGADQAVRVADVLAATANSSTAEILDLALGLQQSSAVAKQTGLNINQTAAALAELADKGIVGQDAGTSLKVMLQRLIPQSKQARDLMGQLGIKVFDASGKFIGITPAIAQYNKGLSKLTPEARAFALNTIFGTDAIRAANIILGGGAAQFESYVKKTERHGAAAALAAARMKGFNGALEAMKSAIQTVAVAFGTGLLPPLTKTIREMSGGLAKPETVARLREMGRVTGEKLGGALRGIGNWFRAHWGEIKTDLRIGVSLLRAAARAAEALFRALSSLVGLVPGPDLLKFAALVAGWKLAKGGGIPIPLGGKGGRGRGGGGKGGAAAAGFALGLPTPVKIAAAGLVAYNVASGSPRQAAAGYGEPVAQTPDGRPVYSKGGKMYVGGDGPGAGKYVTTVRVGGGRMPLYEYSPAGAIGGRTIGTSITDTRGLTGDLRAKTIGGRRFTTKITGTRGLSASPPAATTTLKQLQAATKTTRGKKTGGSEFTLLPASLELGLSEAELTGKTGKQLSALKKIEAYLVKRIAAEKDINHRIEEVQKLKDVRDQIAGLKGAKTSTRDRSAFGELFAGPFLSGENFQTALGFGYKPKAADLVKDIKGQIAQTKTFLADVNTIAKRGAPQGLVDQLLSAGIVDAPYAAALAHASKGTLRDYSQLFREREKQLQQVESMEVHAAVVNIIDRSGRAPGALRRKSGSKFASTTRR